MMACKRFFIDQGSGFLFSFCSANWRTLVLSIRYSASPSCSLSKKEGAVLHLFNQLHLYHIKFGSLLTTFEEHLFYQPLRKARAVLMAFSLGEGRDEAQLFE